MNLSAPCCAGVIKLMAIPLLPARPVRPILKIINQVLGFCNLIQSNLVTRNVLIRNKLVLRKGVNLLHKDKKHLALRNNQGDQKVPYHQFRLYLKFSFSEKATKIGSIFLMVWTFT